MMVHRAPKPMSTAPADGLGPLLDLPEGRTVLRATALAGVALARGGLTHAVGVEGSAAALVARAIAAASDRPVVYITADLETARKAADDLLFLSGGLPPAFPALAHAATLLFVPSETSPYAEVHPERRAAMLRLGTLFHLGKGLPWRFLVAPAAALARRVVPRDAVVGGAGQLVSQDALDLAPGVFPLPGRRDLCAPPRAGPGSVP